MSVIESMYTATTNNICISVTPRYEETHSDPSRLHYVFSYEVTIENKGNESVKLLRRNWIIKSIDGLVRNVEGEGVVGEQPLLKSGECFKYSSWAPISSEIGEMKGSFLMQNLDSGDFFKAKVPSFQFIIDPLLN